MAEQLFEGQTSHGLTHEEMDRLYSKIKVSYGKGDSKVTREEFNAMITHIAKTETGTALLRKMANSDENFNYHFKSVRDLPPGFGGVYLGDAVGVRDRIVLSNDGAGTQHGAAIMAHESVHDLQKAPVLKNKPSNQFVEAEAHALSRQLETEMGNTDTNSSPNYKQVYTANYKKWLKLAKNPKGVPEKLRFKPQPGVDPEKAVKAYARQMASLETQATYIRDFARSGHVSEKDANPPFVFKDETIKGLASDYYNQNNTTGHVDEAYVDDLISRNPFVRQEDFNPLRRSLGKPEVYTKNENDNNNRENPNAAGYLSQNVQQTRASERANNQRNAHEGR